MSFISTHFSATLQPEPPLKNLVYHKLRAPPWILRMAPPFPGQTVLTCLLADGWLASARTESWKPVNLCLKLSPLHARVELSLLSHHPKSGPSLIPRGETKQNFQCSGGKGNINPTGKESNQHPGKQALHTGRRPGPVVVAVIGVSPPTPLSASQGWGPRQL